jgi:hypothetical protein|uniref:PilZ domain-containing protein n=1 Tax=uncultured Sphingomonas sp. TaxID=158754 RepID=UPI0035CC6388
MKTRTIKELQIARRDQRYPTKFAGIMIVDRKPMPIEIADISCVGACLRGSGLPRRGQEIVLRATGLEVVATVVWSDGASCGVNFHKEIAPLAIVRKNPFLPNLNTLTKGTAMRA